MSESVVVTTLDATGFASKSRDENVLQVEKGKLESLTVQTVGGWTAHHISWTTQHWWVSLTIIHVFGANPLPSESGLLGSLGKPRFGDAELGTHQQTLVSCNLFLKTLKWKQLIARHPNYLLVQRAPQWRQIKVAVFVRLKQIVRNVMLEVRKLGKEL